MSIDQLERQPPVSRDCVDGEHSSPDALCGVSERLSSLLVSALWIRQRHSADNAIRRSKSCMPRCPDRGETASSLRRSCPSCRRWPCAAATQCPPRPLHRDDSIGLCFGWQPSSCCVPACQCAVPTRPHGPDLARTTDVRRGSWPAERHSAETRGQNYQHGRRAAFWSHAATVMIRTPRVVRAILPGSLFLSWKAGFYRARRRWHVNIAVQGAWSTSPRVDFTRSACSTTS